MKETVISAALALSVVLSLSTFVLADNAAVKSLKIITSNFSATFQIARHRNRQHPSYLRAGDYAAVSVFGDGDTDLDLYVYDVNGYEIVSDEECWGNCSVEFVAPAEGVYMIKIANRGEVYNEYELGIEIY